MNKDIFLYRKVEFANNLGKKAGALKTGIVTCFMQGKQHDSQLLYALSSSCIINLVSQFVKGIMSWKKYFDQQLSYLNIPFFYRSNK